MMTRKPWILVLVLLTATGSADDAEIESSHLSNIRQVTFGLPRAGEGYFSPDGETIVYQAYPQGYPFYQIYVQKLDERKPLLISPGRGRTTCAYFHPGGNRILFASAHTNPNMEENEKEAREREASGERRSYQWDFDPFMDIYVADTDGSERVRLTDADGYDAEGSYSHDGEQIVFTSMRDGDPDIYVMQADGSNVRQITDVNGYDGGPFFSPDDSWIIFRSDRDEEHMLQIYAVSADGKAEFQLTDDLGTVNWAPYFHPSGDYIIWARADYSQGPQSANFDLYTMDITATETTFAGGEMVRITDHPKADVLPVFSPDGTKLMWTSTRTDDGTSQLWIADWNRATEQ